MRGAGIIGVLSAVALLTSCGQAGSHEPRTLTVLAAASLTESFDELAARFTAEHPDVRVRFDFQGSSTLAEQLKQGRQADVFASANTKNMDKVADTGALAANPETFAVNRLTLVVPQGNPAGIASLADLGAKGRTLVTCVPQVPCGTATEQVEQAAGVRLRPASEENDVKSVLRKVTAGEADAGIVYVSDARSARGQVQAVDIPESRQAVNTYPIAAMNSASDSELAAEFLSFVRGPVGRDVLAKHGFEAP